jgi:hypothetical protein
MSSENRPIFRIRLRLFTAEDSGRRSPIHSGYRPSWDPVREDGTRGYHDAIVRSLGRDPLPLGETTEAAIEPLAPMFWTAVRTGMRLGMFEGPHQVGASEVLEVPGRYLLMDADDPPGATG